MIYPEDCDMTLAEKQALPLETKLAMTQYRIKEWIRFCVESGKDPIVMFSGGFDSSVLLHITRDINRTVKGLFINTGIEFPEIYDHVRSTPDIITSRFVRPFLWVIEKYGYPVISKKVAMGVDRFNTTKDPLQKELRLHGGINPTSGKKQYRTIPIKWHYLTKAPFKITERCCYFLKKKPAVNITKKGYYPLVGTLACESSIRQEQYIKTGCNITTGPNPQSKPLSFWTQADIKEYAKQNNVKISEIYNMGYDHTGCVFCMFGIHKEKGKNRFQLLHDTHPKLWKYCMEKLDIRMVMDYINLPVEPEKSLL